MFFSWRCAAQRQMGAHRGAVICLYAGWNQSDRAFLALDLPGTKLVIGDGPQRMELRNVFPMLFFSATASTMNWRA